MKAYVFKDGSIESYEPEDLSKTVHGKGESGENVLVLQEHYDTAEEFLSAMQAARDEHEREEDAVTLAVAQKTVARKVKEAADLKAAQEKAAKNALAEQTQKL